MRASSGVHHVAAGGDRVVTLHSRSWSAVAGAGPMAVAWAYRWPASVELSEPDGAAGRVRLIDHVMVARTAAVLLLLFAKLIRRTHE